MPLDGQTLPESHQKSESEARNLPPCGCESMTEGPRNLLGVFITLLYTYTMPIKHYSSKPTSLRCHLMAKHCLKVIRNRNLRQEICPHVAVKVWQRALEICFVCSSTYYTPIQCQTSTIIDSKPTSLRCLLMAKHCLIVNERDITLVAISYYLYILYDMRLPYFVGK